MAGSTKYEGNSEISETFNRQFPMLKTAVNEVRFLFLCYRARKPIINAYFHFKSVVLELFMFFQFFGLVVLWR